MQSVICNLLPQSGMSASLPNLSSLIFILFTPFLDYIFIAMENLKQRKSRCSNIWYPKYRSEHKFTDAPFSSLVISPHAGFVYSGMTSLKAVSHVKKNRIWFFGTSHYEDISNGLSIFPGNYFSSIGKVTFPENISKNNSKILEKYLSDEGHRTEEHSIENVLYSLNHFKDETEAFCGLVRIYNEDDFENISDDIAKLWNENDSIIVSTDWNHFVSVKVIDTLMKEVSEMLSSGNIKELYKECLTGKYEACGIDSLYLASKILDKVNMKTNFEILEATDSSKAVFESYSFTDKCVGYMAANNK